ncbi:transcriptional activator ptaB [Physcia stellaris]|nr:transcriptional activator ptaB [Physcia stellaris]
MAEPISFVASVIGIATLAENVATKGYRYLKAARNCSDEVRALMAEVNVLCGILKRLEILVQSDEDDAEDPVEHSQHFRSGDEAEDESNESGKKLQPPGFIYECQKTLVEIEGILNNFGHAGTQQAQSTHTRHSKRGSLSGFRRLEPRDLKWPLVRSKTLQLIQALERYKSTCTMALAGDGLVGIHTVLEQQKVMNKHLADLKGIQGKMLDLSLNQEQEKALTWLSPVNPALKLQQLSRDRQHGTGTWLCDLPEMTQWLEKSNSALWIYGIPGAGKTTLSTLVVEEVLARKRCATVGTGYFYIRHDDSASHKPQNVLGSLIAQLARQNSSALAKVMEFYKKHVEQTYPATAPEDNDLTDLLIEISQYFTSTYIMIDGLDECGPAFDRDRERLINIIAELHVDAERSIRTLIFSRDERDIRKCFEHAQFQIVSIAATSADLRLFANAWSGKLNVRSDELKVQIVDTLVEEAKGMFFWVRAQIDYLQRLPNDTAKRKALKALPPDLWQTYIRILETIDSTYPEQTVTYIQRLLKWLVFDNGSKKNYFRIRSGIEIEVISYLTTEILCQALCIENDDDWPTDEVTPTLDDIVQWLGCLVRLEVDFDADGAKIIQLSHFTIKEFLVMSPENVSSSIARKYLVTSHDHNYIDHVCLSYVMHRQFADIVCPSPAAVEDHLSKHSLYSYATWRLCARPWYWNELQEDGIELLHQFFSIPTGGHFELWDTCATYMADRWDSDRILHPRIPSPLHFAAATGLANMTQSLLDKGADPNTTGDLKLPQMTPFHLAILSGSKYGVIFRGHRHTMVIRLGRGYEDDHGRQRSLRVAKILLDSGAYVNQQLMMIMEGGDAHDYQACVTPLTLALIFENYRVANLLLGLGADLKATANICPAHTTDICSVESFLQEYGECSTNGDYKPNGKYNGEEAVRELVKLSKHEGLQKILEKWQKKGRKVRRKRNTWQLSSDEEETC